MIKRNLGDKSVNNSKNILASLKFNDKTDSISGFIQEGDKDLDNHNANNFIDTYNIPVKNIDENEDNVFNQNLYDMNNFDNEYENGEEIVKEIP